MFTHIFAFGTILYKNRRNQVNRKFLQLFIPGEFISFTGNSNEEIEFRSREDGFSYS